MIPLRAARGGHGGAREGAGELFWVPLALPGSLWPPREARQSLIEALKVLINALEGLLKTLKGVIILYLLIIVSS